MKQSPTSNKTLEVGGRFSRSGGSGKGGWGGDGVFGDGGRSVLETVFGDGGRSVLETVFGDGSMWGVEGVGDGGAAIVCGDLLQPPYLGPVQLP